MSMYQKALKIQLAAIRQPTLFARIKQAGLWLVIFAFVDITPNAFADAYLDALNNAADGLELDSKTSGVASAPVKESSSDATPKNMPTGLSREGFEAFLQKKFFGSFAFYKKLDKEAKQKVFSAYDGKPNIDFVRDQIKRQYLEQ